MIVNSATVDPADFTDQVKWISHGINKLNASPYVRVKFFPEYIEFGSIDESNAYKGKVPTQEIMDPSADEVLLDGEILSKVAKILKTGNTKLEFTKTNMVVKGENVKIDVPVIKNERLPRHPEMPPVVGTVLTDVFSNAVKQVAKSASGDIDKSLVILTCVAVEIIPTEGVIKLTATDRYNLAHRVIPYTPSADAVEPVSFAIKSRSLSQSSSDILNGGIITLHASSENKKFGLSNDSQSVHLGVTGEDYVKYERLLQGKTKEIASLDKRALSSAVNDVSSINKLEHLIFTFENNSIHIKGSNMDKTIEAQYNGEKKEIRFKTEVIRKAISIATKNSLNLHFPEIAKQGVVVREVDEGEEDKNFFGLMMPMM